MWDWWIIRFGRYRLYNYMVGFVGRLWIYLAAYIVDLILVLYEISIVKGVAFAFTCKLEEKIAIVIHDALVLSLAPGPLHR